MHPFLSPSVHNIADVSPEARDKALKMTADLVRKIDEVRKQLELPVDQLPVVIDVYGQTVLALVAEQERSKMVERTTRLPMTMRSENRDLAPVRVLPTQKFSVVVRPQTVAYRPENLKIHGDPSHWMIHDILVGNRSQFASKRGPALGSEFGAGGILEKFKLETLQTAMDFTVIVEYVGPDESGAVFEATVVGLSTDF